MRGRILAAVSVGATMTMMTGTIAIATRMQEGAAAIPAKTTIAPTPTATQPPTTTAATATTSVSADSAGLNESLAGAIGMLSSMTMDGTILPAPDAACFDTAVTGFDGDVSVAAAQLADDPLSWSAIPRETRLPIISAYLGCANIDAVVNLLAIGLINSLEASPCISAAWSGLLSAELIASTLAYGTGLDDLPPEVVNQLVDGAVPCLPDEPWWIDDIAIELERQYDFTPAQATCVATNFVHILGIDRAVERRGRSASQAAASR
jgi:hypothetical protein